MGKRGIIIANTGSPAAPTAEAVRDYLRSFLSDPRICPMPPLLWRIILNGFILPRRSVASAAKYQQIWTAEGSPLAVAMAALSRKLQDSLSAGGEDGTLVRYGMSYGDPSIGHAIAELSDAGCDELVVIPLYPQSAHSTTLVVKDKVDKAVAELPRALRMRFVDHYSDHAAYLDAVATSILDAGFDANADSLLMAFHSIPLKDIEAGDTYDEQVLSSAAAIADRLGLRPEAWRCAFQCRFDKSRKWLGPSTSEAIRELGGRSGRLFVVAPNFSVDCLETYYDIEVELKGRYLEEVADAREDHFVYVPCLNASNEQADLIVGIIGTACVE